MVKHAFKQNVIALRWHKLIGIGEIPIIIIRPRWYSRGDARRQFGEVKAPLLARVAAKEFLAQIRTDAAQDNVLAALNFIFVNADTFEIGCCSCLIEIKTIERVKCLSINREGIEFAINLRTHTMLIKPPICELAEISEDVLGVSMEDMRAIGMDEDSTFVARVKGISADMSPAVDDQDPFADRCQPFSANGAGEASPNYQEIISKHPGLQLNCTLVLISHRESLRGPCTSA
jgi:hypothetical protein